MRKSLSSFLLLSLTFSLPVHAQIETLTNTAGKVMTTDKAPEIIAVPDSSAGEGHLLFVFYRALGKNENDKNKEHIMYQYAHVNDDNAPLVWSNPQLINRDDFRSKEGVSASVIDGRIYLFGKRHEIRYTSASIEEAMQNNWQSWQYLKDSSRDNILSYSVLDTTSYQNANGNNAIALAVRYQREDVGGNNIVALYECQAKSVDLQCGQRSKVSGEGLSKQFYAKSSPAVALAPNLTDAKEPTLYMAWSSLERWQDKSGGDRFLYFRRTSDANYIPYRGDYKSNGITRPRSFTGPQGGNLFSTLPVTILEHQGELQLLVRPGFSGENIKRYRYVGSDNTVLREKVALQQLPDLPIKSKSAVNAVSLNNKLYVVYQDVDDSLNYVIVD